MRGWRIRCALAAAVALAACAGMAPAASARRAPVRPVFGDWEGKGPLGLRLSFSFARRHRHTVARYFALGLPTGCRSSGTATWDAETIPGIEYIPPGSSLHGPFPPLGPTQFELIIPPTPRQPFPVILSGTFSGSRHGTLSIASPTRSICRHTGWPGTLRFSLAATHRVRVADGLWTGSITGPPSGMAGTVKISVIDHGRIETDFRADYTCPPSVGGGGSFEIGPLPTTGYLIGADGSIGRSKGTERAWSGRFSAPGMLAGQLFATQCRPLAGHPAFTAGPSASPT